MVSIAVAAACLFSFAEAQARLSPAQMAKLPPAVTRPVIFREEIKPILEAACVKCHGRGKDNGGFSLETRDLLLKAGDSGPAVVPGKSAESYLIELVSGLDPDNVMPKKGSKLKPDQIALLRGWIDQGLPWDNEINFGKLPPVNLHPRQPELPGGSRSMASASPVDRILEPYFKEHKVRNRSTVDDRAFARRAYLDVIGLLPSPEELDLFQRDRHRDKHVRLVKSLLADNPRYAENWMTFWNDLLRNDYRGTGYIDGGRKQITSWLYSALATNMSFDRFVAELIDPKPESEGFSKGIVWRGAVNASQVPQMQAAQNISQVFMGVNLKCASCHDSFINDWTLADAYGLAGIYSDEKLEMSRCDKPTGKYAALRFIYPELGTIDAQASKAERLKQLAGVVTGDKNGRLSRTLVNRLWARFMGRGLVEPVDEMESPAWNRDLLDWLAEDFVASGYDVKHLIERILTSRAYRMETVPAAEATEKSYVFRGPLVRRMSAEQFRDALTSLTGIGYAKPDAQADWLAGVPPTSKAQFATMDPKWIWSSPNGASQAKAEIVYFRRKIVLTKVPEAAVAVAAADNSFTLFVNGQNVGSGKDFNSPGLFDLRAQLKAGENLIAVAVVNQLPDGGAPTPEKAVAGTENPAGLIFAARLRIDGASQDLLTDRTWSWSNQKQNGWEKLEFKGDDWAPVVELGGAAMEPWKLGDKLSARLATSDKYGKVRSSLVAADPLQVALGRPNREQVLTTRATAATTLQALELTNGGTLNNLLQDGAKRVMKNGKTDGRALINELYLKALGRRPTSAELKLAMTLTGAPVQSEGVADLLWALTMLPEFQLIY